SESPVLRSPPAGGPEDEGQGVAGDTPTASTAHGHLVEPVESEDRRSPPPLPEEVRQVGYRHPEAGAALGLAAERDADVLGMHVGVVPDRLDAFAQGAGYARGSGTRPGSIVEAGAEIGHDLRPLVKLVGHLARR